MKAALVLFGGSLLVADLEYLAGSATLGGPFPGVDTFFGLQIAAQEIADDLIKQGFAKKLGPGRSTSQWWKWVRNKQI